MKLWFDEDLSPTLVQIANELGFDATRNRDRAMLGSSDHALWRLVQAEDYVFVTHNASDFRPLYAGTDVHHGLILMPATVGRDRQQQLTRAVIGWISTAAGAAYSTRSSRSTRPAPAPPNSFPAPRGKLNPVVSLTRRPDLPGSRSPCRNPGNPPLYPRI